MLGDPVLPGEPGVEHAVGDVARHLLRADQHALDLGVVDRRKVRSRIDAQDVAGALKQLDRRVLQRSLRNAEPQLHRRLRSSRAVPAAPWRSSDTLARCGTRCRRLRGATLMSTVSSSQSSSTWRTVQAIARRLALRPQRVARAAEERDVAAVAASAARPRSFMKPTIKTSLLISSCTTAGINPPSFVKSICAPDLMHSPVRKQKSPPLPAGSA